MTASLTPPELYTLRILAQNAQRLQAEVQGAQAALQDYSKRLETQYGQDGKECVVDIGTGFVTLQPKPEEKKVP